MTRSAAMNRRQFIAWTTALLVAMVIAASSVAAEEASRTSRVGFVGVYSAGLAAPSLRGYHLSRVGALYQPNSSWAAHWNDVEAAARATGVGVERIEWEPYRDPGKAFYIARDRSVRRCCCGRIRCSSEPPRVRDWPGSRAHRVARR